MNGSNGLRDKLLRFMQGRYGADGLFYFMTAVYLALVFLNIFFHSWTLHILSLAVFVLTVLRSLSRNIEKRRRENEIFMTAVNKLRARAARSRRMREQSEDYYFKKCPGCKKMLRLPRVSGTHSTRCPACGEQFKVNIKPFRGKRTRAS